ncbi:MAG: methyltransferase domain-containing protein [Firmicutes bacterium]|nr:methyltransferase domain-containing protein [Bacillota bacterium]
MIQKERPITPKEVRPLMQNPKAQDPQTLAANLSLLVSMGKKKVGRALILKEWPVEEYCRLLQHENPKVRKNTARLIGVIFEKRATPAASRRERLGRALMQALLSEDVQMIRSSYILAIGALGQGALLADYQVPAGTLEKHALEEAEALRKARASADASGSTLRPHPFLDYPDVVVLRTALGERRVDFSVDSPIGSRAAWLNKDRTWSEVLVPFLDWKELPSLLKTCLAGDPPYRYRLELKMPTSGQHFSGTTAKPRTGKPFGKSFGPKPAASMAGERSLKIRLMLSEIEEACPGIFINDPSGYELEIRLEADGSRYVKFFKAPDERFSWRKRTLPASIHPANAACIMKLAKPYLKEGARVLDPCCGSGTLLAERAMARPVSYLQGIDIAAGAVQDARENLSSMKDFLSYEPRPVWRIEKADLMQWQPDSLFDEVFANLPFGLRVGNHENNEVLYEALLRQLPHWLKKNGIAVLYTMEGRLLEKLVKKYAAQGTHPFRILKRSRMAAGGLEPVVMIIQVL